MKLMLKSLTLVFVTSLAILGCKKTDTVVRPPLEAHFLFKSEDTYDVAPNVPYKLPIGITKKTDKDRTVEIAVTSPTGAVAGTQYSLNKSSFIIPAGKVVDTLVIQGVFSQYATGRTDTLIFTIKETSDVKGVVSNKQFTLFVRKACLEEEIVLTDLIGTYSNTIETLGTNPPYGPYTTTISAVRSLSPTTGEITVTNVYDAGWSPIKFILDWTDINNRTVTLALQSGIGDASTVFGASFAGRDISVRNHPTGGSGTFSYCKKTLVLRMQLGITGVGWSNSVYSVSMAR